MKKSGFLLVYASLIAGNIFMTPVSYAGTTTATEKVSATLSSSCQISATGINFGSLVPVNGAAPGWFASSNNATISVQCNKNVSYSVALNLGANSGGQIASYMKGQAKGDLVNYAICGSAQLNPGPACAVNWFGSTYVMTGKGTGTTQQLTAYAFYKTGYYTPDTYSDTVTATLSY